MNMPVEQPETPEDPDRRINWSIYLLVTAGFVVIFGGLAPMGVFPILSGGVGFWIALLLGGATGLVVNLVRPRYERTAGRWRSFYDFLLEQLPPPD
jgi:hypothetical protein